MSDLVSGDPQIKEDARNLFVIGGRDKGGEITEIPFDRNETGIFADIPGGRSESLLILVDAKKCSCIRKLCEEDRKSTRLNSSHVAISYAVFCLKKKN